MKVSEVADLADTTVRTVRHYHQLGLLEIPPVIGELTDVLSDIDQHIEILQTKRTRVSALIERAQRGEDVSPLPAELSSLYRRLVDRMPDAASRRAVESERAMAIVLAVRGMLPPAVADLAAAFDEVDEIDTAGDLLRRLAAVGFPELDAETVVADWLDRFRAGTDPNASGGTR